jgi:hypothetical protein
MSLLGDSVKGPNMSTWVGSPTSGIESVSEINHADYTGLLKRGSFEARGDAALELATMLGSCREASEHVEHPEALVAPIVHLLEAGNPSSMESAALALACLAEKEPKVRQRMVTRGAISPLVEMLKHGTPQGKENAAHALGILAHGNEGRKDQILAFGSVRRLIRLLGKEHPNTTRMYAALALGHLANGDEDRKAAVAERGATLPLIRILVDADASAGFVGAFVGGFV